MTNQRDRWPKLALYSIAALMTLSLAGALYEAAGAWVDARNHPPRGILVDIGEGRLHLHCTGSGSPPVILEAGGGDTSLSWIAVQRRLSDRATVCSYDRMGLGWSDSLPRQQTLDQYAAVQKELLRTADIEEPYVLVGHSLGGLIAQYVASTDPDSVAGLVLVDSAHPDLPNAIPELETADRSFVRTAQVLSRLGVVRLLLKTGLVEPLPRPGGLEPEERALFQAQLSRPQHWDTTLEIGKQHETTMTIAQSMGRLPDVPAAVVTHGFPDMFAGFEEAERLEESWQELQVDLARELPQGELMVAADSGHMIPLEQPGLVVEAIEGVLSRVDPADD